MRRGAIISVVGWAACWTATFVPAQLLQSDPWRLDGSAVLRLTYDDNIYLADDSSEVERKEVKGDGTEDDWILSPSLAFELSGDVHEQHQLRVAYQVYSDIYFDESDETLVENALVVSDRWRMCEHAWLSGGMRAIYHDRRDGAEYLRPTYWHLEPFLNVTAKLSASDTVGAGYVFEHRDYDALEDTTYDDYQGHVYDANWRHRFTDRIFSDAALSYRYRNYAETAKDAAGNELAEGRQDDLFGVELALSVALTETTAARTGYRFQTNDSSGPFYDYDEHRISALLAHRLGMVEQLLGSVYVHYRRRDYDHQLAQQVTSGGAIVVDRDEARSDDEWYVRVRLEQGWGEHWTADVAYAYSVNQSNDDSSEYEDNRVELGVRYKF